MKTKMAASPKKVIPMPTLCNNYANEDQEFVFCTKGRPFGCLVSPHLPTPTATLIDYNLVRDVGMKMSDLQYTKLSYAGNKLRILGKVSVSVQTIHDGLASGNFHLKASVVLDLQKTLDIEGVAGVKLSKQLQGKDLSSTSSTPCLGASDLSSDSSAASSPSTPRSTPRRSPRPARAATPPRTRSHSRAPAPKSPPGFPKQPQYRDSVPKQAHTRPPAPRAAIKVSMLTNPPDSTIRGRNLNSMEETFCNADIMMDTNKELRALHEVDPNGRVTVDEDRKMTFVTTGGLRYELGHGRNRCHPAMCMDKTPDQVPNNCGYMHGQWLIPYGFKPCGPNCRAAFCNCINFY